MSESPYGFRGSDPDIDASAAYLHTPGKNLLRIMAMTTERLVIWGQEYGPIVDISSSEELEPRS